MLQDLITKLQGLVGELEVSIRQEKAKLVILEDREKLLEGKESAHKDKTLDLDKRETTVSIIEDVGQARKENDDRAFKLSQEREQFEAQKTAFETYKSEQQQLIDGQREELKELERTLNERAKNQEGEIYRKMEELLKNKK